MKESVVSEAVTREMFDHARRFSNAAYVLNRRGIDGPSNIQTDLLFPQSVCAALALELYFKTLYRLEKGGDFRIKENHSHDFHSLFNLLGKDTRDSIKSIFEGLIQRIDLSYIENFEKVTSTSIPRDLIGNLLAWKDVFVKVRYIHDSALKGLHTFFFPEIEKSVLVSIFRLRPDWMTTTSSNWIKL